MLVRAVLIVILVGLAGCAQVAEIQPTLDAAVTVAPGSHPAYGFDAYLPPNGAPAHDRAVPAMRPLPGEISGLQNEAHVLGATDGNGIAIFGDRAFVGPTSGPISVIDISDPTAPVELGQVEAPGRDIDTIAYPDGRLVTVSTAGGAAIVSADVTDGRNPHIVAAWDTPSGSHNLAVVPGTPIVYNAPSNGQHTDIWDLSDPANPVLVKNWENGAGCHDIMFRNDVDADTYRAYCAGLDVTQIWDTRDPLHPVVITEMPFPPESGVQSAISHVAMPSADGTVLIVGDEVFGAPCEAETALDGTPLAAYAPKRVNIWFYDIRDETAPVVHGRVSPEFSDNACTNHFGRIIHDRPQFVMGFYTDGVLVIDFADIDAPRIVTQYATAGSAWDAWYYQGYVFTGGGNGAMEVLSFT